MWRKRSSKAVLIVAVLACIATSKKGWVIDGQLPARPAPSATQAVQVTLAATREPTFNCGDDQPIALDDSGHASTTPLRATYVCPPGVALARVVLSGKDGPGGGLCSGDPEPPDGESLAISDVRVVPVWTKSVDIPVQLSSTGTFLNLTTRYSYTITASVERDGQPVRMSMTKWPRRVEIYAPDGPTGPAHATVTLYGACRDAGCAPPADADVTGVEGQ